MTPRCVLMTADAVGGVWTYALDLARGLSAQGVQVSLALLGPEPGAGKPKVKYIRDQQQVQ